MLGSQGGFSRSRDPRSCHQQRGGDHGKGEHKEPGGGSVTEGRGPSWDEEGMRAKPWSKKFRFDRRQEMATTHKEVGD